MLNTVFVDDELLFRRPSLFSPSDDAALAEIEFADMEPVDATDIVGVHPYEVVASIPFLPLDLVGVPGAVAVAVAHREPMALRSRAVASPFLPDESVTEEFRDDGTMA